MLSKRAACQATPPTRHTATPSPSRSLSVPVPCLIQELPVCHPEASCPRPTEFPDAVQVNHLKYLYDQSVVKKGTSERLCDYSTKSARSTGSYFWLAMFPTSATHR